VGYFYYSAADMLKINSSGEVIGQSCVGNSRFHAFLYSGGRMTDLGGGYQSAAVGINDTGQMVGNGTGTNAPFLYSISKMAAQYGVVSECSPPVTTNQQEIEDEDS
jgi:probable HAF family extracellular repeat protein